MSGKAFDSNIPPEAFILARHRTAQVLRAGDLLGWNLRDMLGLAYLLGVKDCHDTIDLSDEAWEELKRRHKMKAKSSAPGVRPTE